LTVRSNSFVSGEWLGKLNRVFKEHPHSKESLGLLEAEGVPSRTVLHFLYSYTHPQSRQHQGALRQRARKLARLLQKVGKLAETASKEVESSRPHFELGPMEWQLYLESAAVHILNAAAKDIAPLRQHYHQISSVRGKLRDEGELVYLCLLIEDITGRPHWEDLAYLLEAAFLVHGVSEDWNEDAVRKIVKRFRKDHPKLYVDMADFVRSSHEDPSQRSPARRSTRNRRIAESKPSTPSTHVLHFPTGH